MSAAGPDNIPDIFFHFLPGSAADHIQIDAAEIADTVPVGFHPIGKRRDLIFIGMLGVDAAGDQILHYAENAAAGMQKEGLPFGMDQVNDMPVLRKNVGADIITRQQGIAFIPKIIAEAQQAVGCLLYTSRCV